MINAAKTRQRLERKQHETTSTRQKARVDGQLDDDKKRTEREQRDRPSNPKRDWETVKDQSAKSAPRTNHDQNGEATTASVVRMQDTKRIEEKKKRDDGEVSAFKETERKN